MINRYYSIPFWNLKEHYIIIYKAISSHMGPIQIETTHTHTHTRTHIYIYIYGALNKFPDFFGTCI